MSTNDCDNVLAKLIDTIVNNEKQLEEIKLKLARIPYFHPFTTFKTINISDSGFLGEEDLYSFFRYYGYSVSKIDLRRFISAETQKLNKITYNDFLNQILPNSDIDLRNEILKQKENKHVDIDEVTMRDIGRLVTAIYQNEIEHLRGLEYDKKRLSDFDIALIDVAFLCLADDTSSYLSLKSINTFMKHNGFTFGKIEYDCLMRRVDKSGKSKVSVTDFKLFLLPLDTLNQLNGYIHSQGRSTIDGISPIKSLRASSAKKNKGSPDQGAYITQKASPSSILKKTKAISSPGRHYEAEVEDVRIPASQPKNSQAASQVTFNDYRSAPNSKQNFYGPGNQNIYQADQYVPVSSSRNFYNNQIATIQDNLMYQNAPELDIKHPLENRFLDPTYHSYWSYSRQHNSTLSPEYLSKGEHNLKTKINPALYYNPTFLEPGAYEDSQRYPDNPFRHTDHGHFFQTYYNSLRNSYYDKYYHYTPYKAKIPRTTTRAQSTASKSYNSPMRSDREYNEAQMRSDYYHQDINRPRQSQQNPEQENPYKKSPSKMRDSSRGGDMRDSNHYSTGGDYKLMSQSQGQRLSQGNTRSAIKIDSEAVQRESESAINTFLSMNQPVGDVKPDTPDDVDDLDDRPYKYVIVHN